MIHKAYSLFTDGSRLLPVVFFYLREWVKLMIPCWPQAKSFLFFSTLLVIFPPRSDVKYQINMWNDELLKPSLQSTSWSYCVFPYFKFNFNVWVGEFFQLMEVFNTW